MRWGEIVGGSLMRASDQQAKAGDIAGATRRKCVANQRYQAKMRAAQDSMKLAATAASPQVAQKRRDSASQRMNDARGVFQRAVTAANKAINKARDS
jgi:hypothetical protein